MDEHDRREGELLADLRRCNGQGNTLYVIDNRERKPGKVNSVSTMHCIVSISYFVGAAVSSLFGSIGLRLRNTNLGHRKNVVH